MIKIGKKICNRETGGVIEIIGFSVPEESKLLPEPRRKMKLLKSKKEIEQANKATYPLKELFQAWVDKREGR